MSKVWVAFYKQVDKKYVGQAISLEQSLTEAEIAGRINGLSNNGQTETTFWVASDVSSAAEAGRQATENGLKGNYTDAEITTIREAFSRASNPTMNQIVQALGKGYSAELIDETITNLEALQQDVTAEDVLKYLKATEEGAKEMGLDDALLESVFALREIRIKGEKFDPRKPMEFTA